MNILSNLLSNIQPHGLIIIRGLPGSGKSTLAKSLYTELSKIYDNEVCRFEADDFFISNGEYKFDETKLHHAHARCQRSVDQALECGEYQYVIVSNTGTTMIELTPYLEFARYTDNLVTIINMKNNYGSIHNVPQGVLDKMKSRFIEIKSPDDLGKLEYSNIVKIIDME